ncbi:two-component system regulatory protein YycI [Calidifontibacillus erzurumensis]|uniref:Two-component system regulatory protein YycI n=1 Tax=Calidifontibacillus erzurumensis TaxID=2741433 RepID=A0A8J8GHG2_9BACI|nr:two-component system regulatory protein YycI [Calidifontibacillus erzurumensis]NSL52385.1 two-component system regulatory protein YycI [Calidifontibacillus erzurumensis]
MDWSKTKTIFILIFLVLDLFLVFQFIEKRTTSELEFITESTIEEQLEEDGISYGNLPIVGEQEPYISGKRKKFLSHELSQLNNQSVSHISEDWIVSYFSEPIALPKTNIESFLSDFMKENVIGGQSYRFWKWDKKDNDLIFFQTYQGKTLFFNEHAMVIVHLNEKNEIVSYEQTMLTSIEKMIEEGSNQEVLPPLKAIEVLYKKDYLTSGGHITKVELGYYKNVPISGDVQIFAATWHIVVDDEIDYFVNAIDGQIVEILQDGVGENGFAF